MAKIHHNQEIFIITSKSYNMGKNLEIMKDILEIPLDGTANSDGWSIIKPMEAIYIKFG